jgi:hypothetical protein
MPHSMRMQDALTALVTIALFAAHAPFWCVPLRQRPLSLSPTSLLHVAHIVGTRRLPGTLTQLVPLVAYSSAAYIWLLSPYSIVLSDGHLVEVRTPRSCGSFRTECLSSSPSPSVRCGIVR